MSLRRESGVIKPGKEVVYVTAPRDRSFVTNGKIAQSECYMLFWLSSAYRTMSREAVKDAQRASMVQGITSSVIMYNLSQITLVDS